ILEERKVSNGWDWIDVRWILIKNGRQIERRISHRLYSATELRALLMACGFARTEIYGDLDGNPYDHLRKRLVVVGVKKPQRNHMTLALIMLLALMSQRVRMPETTANSPAEITPPQLATYTDPFYTRVARDNKIEGTVTIEASFDVDG